MDEEAEATEGPVQWFEAESRAVATARAFVRDRVANLGLHAVEDLDLLTSEVVSNAVEHATTDGVIVKVLRSGTKVRVETHDDDPTPVRLKPVNATEPGGLGLRLVAALAKDWGVEEVIDDGKVVWFEIDLPGGPSEGVACYPEPGQHLL